MSPLAPPAAAAPAAPPAAPRPIAVRRRRDLTATRVDRAARADQGNRADPEWVVKDPLSLRYFRFAEHEYFLFQRLDGRIDADALCREFNAAFAPRTITRPRLARFLTTVLRAGLVNVDATGRGRFLDLRRRNRQSDERRARWHGIPSFRFRGVDPTRCLDALLPLGRAAFSCGGLVAFVVLLLLAAGAALSGWDQLVRELAAAPARLQAGGVGALVAAVVGLKLFHELAHGLACRRFDGECRELGLMWVLCTPLPYCDVSDAWTFPDKRHRVLVAAAGILAETLAAALAILAWRFSSPGLFHDVCLFMGAIALANTLFINGNPLMRFDGYFALCDALGISNLAERSSQALRRCFVRRDPASPAPARRAGRGELGYLAYGIASRGYRVAVLFGISLFVLRIGRSFEVGWAAWMFVAWLVAGSTGLVVSRSARSRAASSRAAVGASAPRRALRWAVVAALLGLALFVPLRRSMFGSLVVEAAHREPAHTTVAGRLREIAVRYGEVVAPGQVIARLDNPDLDAEIALQTGELRRREAHLKHLHRNRVADPSLADSIRREEELLRTIRRQLAILQSEHGRLTLTALRAGTLVPPPKKPSESAADRLPAWSGLPLDPQNLGANFEPGVLLGEVSDTDSWVARVTLDDGAAARLRAGDQTHIWLASRRSSIAATIQSIEPVSEAVQPSRYELAGQAAPAGAPPRAMTVRYRVTVRLPSGTNLCPGESGEARLDLPPESLARQTARWCAQTFGTSAR